MRLYFILILFNCFLLAEYSGGFPGASFQYGTNAREIALSRSTLSTYNTGFNSFINPALLPNIKNNEYGFSHFLMSLDRSIQTISISRPLPPSAGVSMSFFRSGTDNIIETSSDFGDVLGNLSHSEGFGMLSFGIDLGKISGGFNIKAYFNNLDNYSGDGIGVDLGVLYEINQNINFALKLNNLSGNYSWDIDSQKYEEDILNNYSVGFSYNDNRNLIMTSQIDFLPIVINTDNNKNELYEIYRIGLEYNIDYFMGKEVPIILRSGIRLDDNKSFYSMGFGFPVIINNKLVLNIDYALDPGLVDEGISHLFSFTILNY